MFYDTFFWLVVYVIISTIYHVAESWYVTPPTGLGIRTLMHGTHHSLIHTWGATLSLKYFVTPCQTCQTLTSTTASYIGSQFPSLCQQIRRNPSSNAAKPMSTTNQISHISVTLVVFLSRCYNYYTKCIFVGFSKTTIIGTRKLAEILRKS